MFMGLLISIVNASNHTKCISLKNQKCMIQSTFINLHPVGSCNTLNDLSNKVYVPNKRKKFKSKRVQHDNRNK